MTRHHHRDEDSRHHEGEDEYTILRHLSVGNAFHTTEYGVEEDHGHAYIDAGFNFDL